MKIQMKSSIMQHCLLRKKKSSEKEFYLEIITCYSSIYTMDYPLFIVSNQQEESISAYRVKKYHTSLLSLSRLETCDLNFSTVAVETASQRWGVTDGSARLKLHSL